VEVLSPQLALTLKRGTEFDNTLRTDPVTGLPGVEQLEQLLGTDTDDPELHSRGFSLVFIDILNVNDLTALDQTFDQNEAIRQAAIRIQSSLRFADILFRVASDRFVAFLHQTHEAAAELIAETVCERIRKSPVRLSREGSFSFDVRTTCVCGDRGNTSLGVLAAEATVHADSCSQRSVEPTVLH